MIKINQSKPGWEKLLEGFPWYGPKRDFPLAAYSEYMSPKREGINPFTGEYDPRVFDPGDPYGWMIPEIEEEYQIKTGLEHTGQQVMNELADWYHKSENHLFSGHLDRNLSGNPYFSPEILETESVKGQNPFVIFLPVSLSKTQDDLGRVRWTLFGGSEQGPEKAFWKSFYTAPGKELPEQTGIDLILTLLERAYGEKYADKSALYHSGFRILPSLKNDQFPYWMPDVLPSWTKDFMTNDEDHLENTRFLLTFRPYTLIPEKARQKFREGKLHLLPCPGSLVPFGAAVYTKLQHQLPMAMQLPVLRMVHRHEGISGIRVPQSAWMHEKTLSGESSKIAEHLLINEYRRTSRWDRVHRFENAIDKSNIIHPVIKTLFSTGLDYLGLYNKPMARNCQLWNEHSELILDGPNAGKEDIEKAALIVLNGGSFRYRFLFPAMQAGLYQVNWQRPLIGFFPVNAAKPAFLTDHLGGYLSLYPSPAKDLSDPIELWPRILKREEYLTALREFSHNQGHFVSQTSYNLRFLFDTFERLGNQPLEKSFAEHLLIDSRHHTFDSWKHFIQSHAHTPEAYQIIVKKLEQVVSEEIPSIQPGSSYTFDRTANRAYEINYWNDILYLSHGSFINKDNADIVTDKATLREAVHPARDLSPLGDYLLLRHRAAIAEAGMENRAVAGELPFQWETDFDFIQFGGWKANRDGMIHERDLLVIIPGKNRKEAVILADHYDTAYMADVYDPSEGGTGARLSAAGADDNDSATATLLQAASIYLSLAKEEKLERDIWLLHLTGEEFPSDCLGARHFCKALLEKKLVLHVENDKTIDLSDISIRGVFVMDMIAHNREDAPYVFQISPGKSTESLILARHAHQTSGLWNASVETWNQQDERKGKSSGKRCNAAFEIPEMALHPKMRGEIRLPENPFSTLYNTDALMFSDCGLPVVLFMEDYDITRSGYHDTKDTMANIDLDYGSALSAIAIETTARIACLKEL